jgi:excisionase family DNA binding protein
MNQERNCFMADMKFAYTPQEVADRLSLDRGTVYRLIAAGRIPAVRIGRAVRVSHKVLMELAEKGLADAA